MAIYVNRRKAMTHPKMYPAVLRALARNYPIEVAPLLSPPYAGEEF
jgi:hypothetical protein